MRWLLSLLITFHAFLISVSAVLYTEGGFFNAPVDPTAHANTGSPYTAEQLEPSSGGLTPTILQARAEIFGQNIHMISQQMGSVLLPFVQMEGMVGNGKTVNRLGVLPPPFVYGGSGSNIETVNPDNDVRWIKAVRYYQACFVDNYDQIRTLWDIRNAYNQALGASFGRLYDRVTIAAALGSVCAGKNGQTRVDLPYSQRMVSKVPAINPQTGSANTSAGDFDGLNIEALRAVRLRMKANHVIQKGDMLTMVVSATEIDSLLGINQVINADFSNTRGLWNGEVTAFLGFLFIETELIPNNTSTVNFSSATGLQSAAAPDSNAKTAAAGKGKRAFCMVAGKSLCFAINVNQMTKIEPVQQKHWNWLIYHSAEIGATRKEEVAIMEVLCKDSLA